jgi:hypothetical protein
MSSDLDVKLYGELLIVEVVNQAELVLQSLLGLSQTPQLSIIGQRLGEYFAVTTDTYIPSDDAYLIGLKDTGDAVSLVTFELKLQFPYILEEEAGQRAGIIVGAMKSPVEWAIAASMAITLADKEHTSIQDSGLLWTNIEEQPAGDFAEKITVVGSFDDIFLAADAFYSNLSINKH